MQDSPRRLRPLAKRKEQTKVEQAKAASNFLRGTIAESLADGRPTFGEDDVQLLKFHGCYQQDDRDAREAARATGGEKEYSLMVRVKVPGGVLTADQYLAMDRLCDDLVGYRSLRATTRQNFQVHGVLKGDLKELIRRVNESMLSTLCGCGDVERNVMAPAAPLADPAHRAVRALARQLSAALCPQTRAYHEIWLDDEKVGGGPDAEPLYGPHYLPRKFKTGIALPEDNAADVYSQDVGLIAVVHDGRFVGANVLVGGGMGMTHRKPETYARLATPLGYVAAEHVVETVRAVAAIFRDFGDRTDRKHARLKYVVEECGIEAFADEFRRRVDFELAPWVETAPLAHRDWLGEHDQGDGRRFYGLHLPSGRIVDSDLYRRRTAIRKLVEAVRPGVVLTPNQNVLFTDLDEKGLATVKAVLAAYGLASADQLSAVRRYALACPALPTCGQALTEAERVVSDVLDALEREFARLGVDDTPITIRMTGCPNGCTRPYTADLGLVGHKPGHYDIFVGGRLAGDRIGELYAENVPMGELVCTLGPLLEAWAARRMPEEGLGDFYRRVGGTGPAGHIVTGARDNPTRARVEAALAGDGDRRVEVSSSLT